jgi:hypothetical protein
MTNRRALPNWIIAGVPKAGTSALFRWLVDHPDVAGPTEKETYYFVDPGTHMFRADRNFRDHGLAGYEKLFEACPSSAKVIVEATPGYIYSETAIRELPNLPSRPHFIFVLREPVAQLRSLFCYFQQNWNWIPRQMSFRDFVAAAEEGSSDFRGNELAVNALANAVYPRHLRRWRDAVGADRMLIILFEDLVAEGPAAMRWVAGRLGIEPSFYDGYNFPSENSTYSVRNGTLQDLNVRLRGRLPRGRLYHALRRLYRAINTHPSKPEAQDFELERALSERFVPMLAELERDFGLDLAKWRAVHSSRRLAAVENPSPADRVFAQQVHEEQTLGSPAPCLQQRR